MQLIILLPNDDKYDEDEEIIEDEEIAEMFIDTPTVTFIDAIDFNARVDADYGDFRFIVCSGISC